MTQSAVPSPALDYPALADRLVRHMALQPGEKVLLLSYPGQFEPLVSLLRQGLAVMLPGASPGDPEYAAMQEVLREGRGRTIHFHWAFAGGQVWVRDGKLTVP